MLRKTIIVQALVLIWQIFLPCIVRGYRDYGCMEGECAMDDCRTTPGNLKSTYCWIAADSVGNIKKCGGREDCRVAAQTWGNCKFLSCFANRAPSPLRSFSKTCENMNDRKVGTLMEECESYSFEKWTRDYNKPAKIVKKFEPCVGSLIEDEAKKVIKYCFCYNSCGKDQTESCEVTGLDRRLDLHADTKTTYAARCAIDCEPTDKYKRMAVLENTKKNRDTLKVSITKGTSASKTISSTKSKSLTVSGEVGAEILENFSVKLGLSAETGFDWSSSSSSISIEEVKHEIGVEIDPGDVVEIYQVIGECKNSDGTTYTFKTGRYETRLKTGKTLETTDVPPEEGSKQA